ncbi:MAG: hypothetical protein RLY97_1487 [Pseudomonadota bacterium]
MSDESGSTPRAEFDIEQAAIDARRTTYGLNAKAAKIGLALSGGGIRSATFSLGLLQELSRQQLLQKVDYLSTVSGGGYIGAFYTGLFARRDGKDGADKVPAVVTAKKHDDLLGQDGAKQAIGYLRQSGRYMTPAGSRDLIMAMALLTRNWLTLTLVMGVAVVLGELGLDWLRDRISGGIGFAYPEFATMLVPGLGWLGRLLGTEITFQGLLRASPLLGLLPVALGASLASGWSYWLTMSNVARQWWRPVLFGSLMIFGGALYAGYHHESGGFDRVIALFTAIISGGAMVLSAVAWMVTRMTEGKRVTGHSQNLQAMRQDQIRLLLTAWQGYVVMVSLALVGGIVADGATLLLSLFQTPHSAHLALGTAALSTIFVPAAQQLLKLLLSSGKSGADKNADAKPLSASQTRPSLLAKYGSVLAGLIAGLLVLAALAFWGELAHLLAWEDRLWIGSTAVGLSAHFGSIFLITLIFVALCATTQSFVNLSSLSTFYASRLRRAYLGAGNGTRLSGANGAVPVQDGDVGDDLGLVEYYRRTKAGAPVHIINVTINETRGKGAQTVQQDRHGLNLAITPQGLCWSGENRNAMETKPLGSEDEELHKPALPGQSLPVSAWVGISGAAFSTGMGGVTNLSYAILMFLSNVRLGYWWLQDRSKKFGGLIYGRLIQEMTANFHGTDKAQWYLSDGGHFENTAVYELVRRKLPFIITSDNGADPGNALEDIANLVRKCRIDFAAELQFLSRDSLDKRFAHTALAENFTTPEELLTGKASASACAMLAKISYADGSFGTLVVVKPRLTLDMPHDIPADVARYKLENRSFPQQTTFDQFFDEAQWESYRALGQIIGHRLFVPLGGALDWQPHDMEPVIW